jgi:hypothetical protein
MARPPGPEARSRGDSVDLPSFLEGRKGALLDAWFARALEAYPADTAKFLRSERDAFANPVGTAFRKSLPVLLDFLLGKAGRDEASRALLEIVRIRAVQETAPSRGLSFLLPVRSLLLDEASSSRGELGDLEGRVDELAMLAFDLWSSERERMGDIKVREMKRRMYMVERASGLLDEGSGPGGSGEPSGG